MATKTKKLKKNDWLTFKEEEWKLVEQRLDSLDDLEGALMHVSKKLRKEKQRLWDYVRTVKPELKLWKLRIKRKDKVVELIEKKY